jgi:transposase-like protein
MDTDAPHPHCPFCGLAMQFKRTSPNFGAQPALQTFVCNWCGVVLNIPPQAASEIATPVFRVG